MKLEKIEIKGFRKLEDAVIDFGDASFLIGENNAGKSSILRAIELILTNNNVTPEDFSKKWNPEENIVEKVCDEICLIATFSNLPDDADSWVGIKGRVYEEDGIRKIKYKKTYTDIKNKSVFMWEQKKTLREDIKDGKKVTKTSLLGNGISEDKINKLFPNLDGLKNLDTNAERPRLEEIYEAWDYEDDFDWKENPGGIPQNVMSKLPRFVLIPAEHKSEEIASDQKSALGAVMTTIFQDVVDNSQNFREVKSYFSELEREVDTENENTEFGSLMVEVNKTIKTIFPDSQIQAKVNLSDPSTFLRPTYDIKLGSNVMTDVSYQGTGMIRSTAFSLLKFREEWNKEREKDLRSLIIAFEEPELFLHPNASNQMRDTIYDLANEKNQIICTSHSPYMIDLSREKSRQIINNITITPNGFVNNMAFSATEKFKELSTDDRQYIKMLIKIDDYFARAFFAKKIVIVEGDTEDVVMRKTVEILDKDVKNKIKSDFQFIKARGKATIPPLIRYFEALGISDYFVIHDRDQNTKKAEQVNPRILDAIHSDENKRIMMEECIEDTLGYKAPSQDKPHKAFVKTQDWRKLDDVPEKWKTVVEKVFKGYLSK